MQNLTNLLKQLFLPIKKDLALLLGGRLFKRNFLIAVYGYSLFALTISVDILHWTDENVLVII